MARLGEVTKTEKSIQLSNKFAVFRQGPDSPDRISVTWIYPGSQQKLHGWVIPEDGMIHTVLDWLLKAHGL